MEPPADLHFRVLLFDFRDTRLQSSPLEGSLTAVSFRKPCLRRGGGPEQWLQLSTHDTQLEHEPGSLLVFRSDPNRNGTQCRNGDGTWLRPKDGQEYGKMRSKVDLRERTRIKKEV